MNHRIDFLPYAPLLPDEITETLLDNVSDALVMVDGERRIVYWNKQAEALTGFTAGDAVGRLCRELLDAGDCQRRCPLNGCPTLEQRSSRLSIRTKAGEPIHVRSVTVPLAEGGRARGVLLRFERAPAEGGSHCCGMVGSSRAMKQIFRQIRLVGPSEASVLITGESGTGKEHVALALHATSPRRDGPFVAINCAAMPEGLLDSEMFGHQRGAFTGAVRDSAGRVAQAEGGTLFLDEVGEMPLALQSKLLRFLQDREYYPVGSTTARRADVRIIAATNRDLPAAIASGEFRQDLYYRLRVVPLVLPPLRERREDIPSLIDWLVAKLAQKTGLHTTPRLSLGAQQRLLDHRWPGNVRELENALHYALVVSKGRPIRVADLPAELVVAEAPTPRYRADATTDERASIVATLRRCRGNRSAAARELGMNRATLYRKLQRHGI